MWTAGFPEPRTFSRRVARLLNRRRGDFDVVHDNQCLGTGLLDIAGHTPVVATVHHPITRDRTVDLNPDHWEWQKAARCRGEDLTIFFGADRERGRAQNEREARAKRICAECTVIAECRHYATVHQEPFGVWGGLSERERRRTLRYT